MKTYFPVSLSVATLSLLNVAPALAACTPGENQAAFYQHANYKGKCVVLDVGRYENAAKMGIANDSISSAKLGAGVWAIGYEHANFGGRNYRHEKSEQSFPIIMPHGQFSAHVNPYKHADEASSIEVRKINKSVPGPAPVVKYLGNYPADRNNGWSEGLQGVAHDQNHWFFTQKDKLWKFPVGHDLKQSVMDRVGNRLEYKIPANVKLVPIPKVHKSNGYDHFGDLVHHNGYLYIPLEAEEGKNSSKPILAVFRASTLAYVGFAPMPKQTKAGWVSINPSNNKLYSSGNNLNYSDQLIVYNVSVNESKQNPISLTYHSVKSLYDEQGRTIVLKRYMQGGDFSDDGKFLFLVNGRASSGTPAKDGGVWVFDFKTGKKLLKSESSGPFKYEYHPGAPNIEEPEGITFWNRNDYQIPDIEGNLHVILLNNNVTSSDSFWFKHYRVGDIKTLPPSNLASDQIRDLQKSGVMAQRFEMATTTPPSKPGPSNGVVTPPVKRPPTNSLAAPSNLQISKVGRTTLALSWQDNATTEFGVEIYRIDPVAARMDPSVNWEFLALSEERVSSNVSGTGLRADEDFDLTPNKNYCYKVRSYIGFSREQVSEFTKSACAKTAP